MLNFQTLVVINQLTPIIFSTPTSEYVDRPSLSQDSTLVYSYMIEQCHQSAQKDRVIYCKIHGNMGPWFIASQHAYIVSGHMAPDAVSFVVICWFNLFIDFNWLKITLIF